MAGDGNLGPRVSPLGDLGLDVVAQARNALGAQACGLQVGGGQGPLGRGGRIHVGLLWFLGRLRQQAMGDRWGRLRRIWTDYRPK